MLVKIKDLVGPYCGSRVEGGGKVYEYLYHFYLRNYLAN